MKKIKLLSIIAVLTVLIATFESCRPKFDDGFYGNSICPENFQFLSAFTVSGGTGTDFNLTNADTVKLRAVLNQKVKWWITITGKTSSAVKRYSGNSDTVAVNWFGNASEDIFFENGEECEVQFEVACQDVASSIVKITGKPTFENIDFGRLLNDFDGHGIWAQDFGVVWKWPGHDTQGDTLTGLFTTIDTILRKGVNYNTKVVDNPSPQKGKALKMTGWADDIQWHYGGFGFSGTSTSVRAGILEYGSKDPANIYGNLYVFGDQTNAKNAGLVVTYNISGNKYAYIAPVEHEGWQMVSFSFADLQPMESAPALDEVEFINDVSIELASNPEQGKNTFHLTDFVTITFGAPYQDVQ